VYPNFNELVKSHPNRLRLEDRSKWLKGNLERIINICKALVYRVITDKCCITGLHLLRVSLPIFGYFNSLFKKAPPHSARGKVASAESLARPKRQLILSTDES
jgi:hypothetical protein